MTAHKPKGMAIGSECALQGVTIKIQAVAANPNGRLAGRADEVKSLTHCRHPRSPSGFLAFVCNLCDVLFPCTARELYYIEPVPAWRNCAMSAVGLSEKLNNAVNDCLATCYAAPSPALHLTRYLAAMAQTGRWSAAEVASVRSVVVRILRRIAAPEEDDGLPIGFTLEARF